jgi:hypothetical protein
MREPLRGLKQSESWWNVLRRRDGRGAQTHSGLGERSATYPFRLVKKSGIRSMVLDVLLDEMLDAISGKNADSVRYFNK